jgi:glycerol-3-phosphate dehydrogenase (NAD(P)+)
VQALLFPPQLSFARASGGAPAPAPVSVLAAPLPPSIHLLTVHAHSPTALLLRLAHLFEAGEDAALSAPAFRLYHSEDVIGVEIGGAAKNVLAIACGIAAGRGLGASAVAALVARGFAELSRFGQSYGARPDTLMGLSGLGDLVLTCTSLKSRNLRFGIALGAGTDFDPTVTVEGVATAKAVARLARTLPIPMPITQMVADLIDQTVTLDQAVRSLMSRPLKQE